MNSQRFNFALKVFDTLNGREYCEEERESFHGLREHGGMVQFFGAYSQENDLITNNATSNILQQRPSATYHLLLEYGERDLIDFFQTELPPVMPDEIQKFWINLFGIATTLKGIHNRTIEHDGIRRHFWGHVPPNI